MILPGAITPETGMYDSVTSCVSYVQGTCHDRVSLITYHEKIFVCKGLQLDVIHKILYIH